MYFPQPSSSAFLKSASLWMMSCCSSLMSDPRCSSSGCHVIEARITVLSWWKSPLQTKVIQVSSYLICECKWEQGSWHWLLIMAVHNWIMHINECWVIQTLHLTTMMTETKLKETVHVQIEINIFQIMWNTIYFYFLSSPCLVTFCKNILRSR